MLRRFCLFPCLLAACFWLAALPAARAENWPTFRGASRTAVSPDAGLIKTWPKDGPKLLWTAEGAGRGYSSLAIADGRIYTLGDSCSTADDNDEYLSCFNEATGKQLWLAKTGDAWMSGQESWQSSRSTPTVDGDRVYVLTAFGKLICVSTADGSPKWEKDLKAEFGGDKADGWGYSESVLIDGEKLVCTPGKSENTMVALNKLTGEKIWSSSRENDRGAGHASIVISDIGGTRVYVTTTGSGAMGVRASDGELMWTYDIDKTTAVIPTPIVRDDLVFFTAGYGRGGALLKQVAAGDGKVAVDEVYPLNKDLGNKHGGVVLVGDYLYGDSEDRGLLFCADLMTGEQKWKSRGPGKNSASVVAADGQLYVRYANGTVALVEASPEGFQEAGNFQVPGSGDRPSWAHPVVVDGNLLLREGDQILSYSLKP